MKEGGLGIRSLSKVNEGVYLKLCWELIHSNYQWAQFLRSRVLKKKKPISYHLFSSVWSGIKHKYLEVLLNSAWNLGDRVNINFWTDIWCGKPLVEEYSIDPGLHDNLSSTVNLFIQNAKCKIPQSLIQNFPNIHNILENATTLVIAKDDDMLWNLSSNGDLCFKDAYLFHCSHGQNIAWAKVIWNKNIPPSKSMMIWRSLHNKLPSDDILSFRGCHFPSMCSLCNTQGESIQHLFFECSMSKNIWHWLSSKLDTLCYFSSITEALDICNRQSSPLCKLVVLAAVVVSINKIWYCRNQMRFTTKPITLYAALNLIITGTSLDGNLSSLHASSSMTDCFLLHAFSVKVKHENAPRIKEVIWQPPVLNWIKRNIDGACKGNHGPSSCGGILRNSAAEFLGAFVCNLGISNSLIADLNGAMLAIEIASQKGWRHIWLETDSMLVTAAFKSIKIVPWHLRNRWQNCLHLCSSMSFFVTHIYREGNHCADKLADIGFSIQSQFWWDSIPSEII